MIGRCPSLHFFDDSPEDLGLLKSTIDPILQTAKDVEYSELYNNLISALEQQGEVSFGSDSFTQVELDAYEESIKLMRDRVIELTKSYLDKSVDLEYINSLTGLMNENFLLKAGLTSDDPKYVELPSEFTIEGVNDSVEEEENLIIIEDALNFVYGTSEGAKQTREAEFNVDLIKAIIIDVDNDIIINDLKSLNRSISNYKSKQFENIVKYLRTKNSLFYSVSSSLYDNNGKLNEDYHKVMNAFKDIIQSKDFSSSIGSMWTNFMETDIKSPLLQAADSYINLQYFDSLLKKSLGKVIQLSNPDLENIITDSNYYNYNFGRIDEHKVKHWGVNDVRDALGNISKFSKLVLSTVKIYSKTDGKFLHKYVDVKTFSNAVTHLFGALLKVEGTQYSALKKYADKFHSGPYTHASKLLELLYNLPNPTKLFSSTDFTPYDYDVLTSVYRELYDRTNKKSIISVETRAKKQKFSIGRYSIIDSINGVMDRTMQASYLLTVYDSQEGYVTSTKSKYNIRRESYNIVNAINYKNIYRLASERLKLLTKYGLSLTGNTEISFNIGKLNPDDKDNVKFSVLFPDGVLNVKGVKIICDNELFNNVFRPKSSAIDLSSGKNIKRILSNKNLNTKELLFRNVLEFIDDFLDMQLLSENGLATLNVFKSQNSDNENYIEGILQYAVKSAVVNNFYNNFNNDEKYEDYQFEDYMDDHYFGKDLERKSKIHDYFKKRYGLLDLMTIYTEAQWLDSWCEAKAILSADASKSTTKDLNKNMIGNYRTSFLGGNLRYYLNKFKSEENSAVSELLFSKNDLIRDVVINTDAKNKNGDIKRVRDMKASELYYSHIIHNFYGTYLQPADNKHSLGRCFVIQPTTMSDKETPINYAIDGKQTIAISPENNKSLAHMTTDEKIDVMVNTIGSAYKMAYNNILNTYKKLFGQNLTEDEIISKLNTYNESKLLAEVNAYNKKFPNDRIEIKREVHYRKLKNGTLSLNELYHYYANELYADRNKLIERLNYEKVKFVEDLIDAGVNFYTGYASDSFENEAHPIYKIINSRNLFNEVEKLQILNEWVSDSKLILAKTADGKNIKYIKDLKNLNNLTLNPILEKYFYTDVLVSNNLRFPLTGTEAAHPDKSKVDIAKELRINGITGLNEQQLLDLGIADMVNGKAVVTSDIIKLSKSTDARVQTTYKNIMRKIESIALGTQYKRNVIIPATLQYEQMGVLNGILPKIKVAVIEDTKAAIWNFRGDGSGPKPKTEDAHDGGAWQNPFTSILENYALQDLEVGVDKKPIWHSYDAQTMSDVLLKFAVFTMTNERMRASMQSDISLYNLFKKMTDLKWFEDGKCNFSKEISENEFNLLTTIGFKSSKNAKINFREDILNNEELFYKQGNSHYLITDFGYDENGYFTKERKVLLNGNTVTGEITYYHKFDAKSNHYKYTKELLESIPEDIKNSKINSLFQLFNVFGGIYSEVLVDGELKFNEKSSQVVANFMNNISIRTNDKKSDQMDQNVYYQPLKEMMISYAVNPSSMKVGPANVNPVSSWEDDTELSYMTLDSDGLGIQMDPDHDIDEAEMTEFSLVISALAAGGRLYDVASEVYHQLGELAILASKLEVEAVDAFIELAYKQTDTDSEQYHADCELLKSHMYDIIGKVLINNYRPNNEKFDLAKPIIEEIKKQFNTFDNHALAPLKLAFSDPNLYGTVIATFMSNLNKKSIKRQYTGSGCVMVPGYNIIQVYKINGIPYQFDDLVEKAWRVNAKTKFFDQYDQSMDLANYNNNLVKAYLNTLQAKEYDNAQLTLDSYIPTDIVDVIVTDENAKMHKLGELNFDQIDFYYKCKFQEGYLKQYLIDKYGINPETQLRYANNITKPRNLAPARITWEINGRKTNIFDTEEVANSFGYTTRKDYLGKFNTSEINRNIYELEEDDVPRKDNPELSKHILRIYLKGKRNKGFFELDADKDINGKYLTGAYSIHLKTATEAHPDLSGEIEPSTAEERALLYNALYQAIPNGVEVSTWGSVSEGGVKALEKFGKRFIKYGEREVTSKETGETIKVGVYRKNVLNRSAILKVFDDLNDGIYHGQQILNFNNEPAELIMSDLYASKRGKSAPLSKVLEEGSDIFKHVTLPKVGLKECYDFIFTSNNNKNLFFTFGKVKSPNLEPVKLKWRTKTIERKNEDGTKDIKVYHTNKEGELQFLVGRYRLTNLIYDEESKTIHDENGKIYNKEHFKIGENKIVYEYFEYITGYNVFEESKGKINSYKVYKINKNNVYKSLTNATNKDVNKALGEILASIYANNSFSGVRLNGRIPFVNAVQMQPVLERMSEHVPTKEANLLRETNKYLLKVHELKDLSLVDIDAIRDEEMPKYSDFLLNYYNSNSDALYASYLKALHYTAARIPALTLQSFMQMKLVGFTTNSKNICYVSHWQTYLQGSDYDIDKAYIMGLALDDNGMYIGWSNLFDYSTLKTIEASEHLPLPKDVIYTINNELGVDISTYIGKINDAFDSEQRILAYAELLQFLEKEKVITNDKTKKKYVYVKFNPQLNKELTDEIMRNLNRHASTKLNGDKLQQAVKNSISSKILRIIQNPRNMDLAYTSIDGEMERIRKAASVSPKGNKISGMTMLNPLTKYLMQVSNMTGKGVIGIAANGEKVFFNLTNYWNEGIRSGDQDWIKNLRFENTFSRIYGRSTGNPVFRSITILPNVNFEGYEDFKEKFSNAMKVDKELRNKYGITDADILLRNDNWKKYNNELTKSLKDTNQYVDLNISALLSAATDNAKELILYNINAGTNLAKCHIHLIILGFSLDDIASFMISPAVSLAEELSNANMFDEYLPKLQITDAFSMLKGNFNLNKFFNGDYFKYQSKNPDFNNSDESSQSGKPNAKKLVLGSLSKLKNLFDERAKLEILDIKNEKEVNNIYTSIRRVNPDDYARLVRKFGEENIIVLETILNDKNVPIKYKIISPKEYMKLDDLVKTYFNAKIKGDLTEELSFKSFLNTAGAKQFNRMRNNVGAFSDLIDTVVEKIKSSGNLDDFYSDLSEFEKLYKLSEETSRLGSTFLKLNQGFPTDESGIVNLMLKFLNAFDVRFNETIEEGLFSYIKDPEGNIESFTINSSIYNDFEVKEAIDNAIANGVVSKEGKNLFDIEKWINDKNGQYRKATSDFYNLIKGSWNLFDIVEKVPHFAATFKLLRISFQMNNNLIRKSHIVWTIAKNIYKGEIYIDPIELDKLQVAIDNQLIINWLQNKEITFPIFKGDKYFTEFFEKESATKDGSILIINENDRATFKLNFENLIELLKSGTYNNMDPDTKKVTKNNLNQALIDNKFIKNLVSDVTSDGMIYYKLNLDMLKIAATLFNSKNYQECLDGFLELRNYKFYGRPLTDWFMLYNIIVNKNMWGSNRLTSLFGPFINILGKENSLIKEYFLDNGEADWKHLSTTSTLDDLKANGLNIKDILWEIAPVITEEQESTCNAKLVKEYDEDGMLITKLKFTDGGKHYETIKVFESLPSLNSYMSNLNRISNYLSYSTLQTPFYNRESAPLNMLLSALNDEYSSNESIDKLRKALYHLTVNGILTVEKLNC